MEIWCAGVNGEAGYAKNGEGRKIEIEETTHYSD